MFGILLLLSIIIIAKIDIYLFSVKNIYQKL